MPSGPVRRVAFATLAAMAWFALVVQSVLLFLGSATVADGLARTAVLMAIFFTNWNAFLVAVVTTVLAVRPGHWVGRPRMATAVCVYASVVLAIYELFLRRLWHPHGLSLVADTLFHDAMPVGYVAAWWAFLRQGTLRWRDAWPWLVVPLAYGLFVLAVGLFREGAPYPFLDATSLGAGRVALNLAGLLGSFWGIGLVYVAVDRAAGGRTEN